MLASTLIVFREVLEAALIITIVMAAARGASGLRFWISGAVLAGVGGAAIVAFFADVISAWFAGTGQELFNATVLFVAVGFLGWHIVWMQKHGRELAAKMKSYGQAIVTGDRSMIVLAVVVAMAVLREGSEVVLFVYGILAMQNTTSVQMLSGAVLGLAGGALFGVLFYFGLIRLSSKYLFTVTNWLILFLAAGMAAQATKFLVQADILPAIGNAVWDTSFILSEKSVLGQIVHTLTGYVARPDGVQVIAYLLTLSLLGSLMVIVGNRKKPSARMTAPVAAILVFGLTISSGQPKNFQAVHRLNTEADPYEFVVNWSVDTARDRFGSGC